MRITVMPPLWRWTYRFPKRQKAVMVKFSQRRWNPATMNNLRILTECDVTHTVINGKMKRVQEFSAGVIPY
jgi:hypothetical protein